MRELRHRIIGGNAVPHEIWIDSLDDALALIGKRREAQRFAGLAALTQDGFERLANAAWLRRSAIHSVHYWGDIDTHGFAIPDPLRAHLPHVPSFLMHRPTLLAHRPQWGVEPKPERRDLPRLTAEERALFDDLRDNRIGTGVRLEQERIGFGWVRAAREDLP